MSLPHALLTALIESPSSGSELASRFDRSIGYFWHATHQQIYRELSRLEAAGWIESLPEEQGRGRKRAYRILDDGRRELKRWAAAHEDPKPLREELMVRLRAEAVVGPTGLEEDIKRRLALHRERLDNYRRIQSRDFAGQEPSRELQLQHLVLKAGIRYENFCIEVSNEALEVLSQPASKR